MVNFQRVKKEVTFARTQPATLAMATRPDNPGGWPCGKNVGALPASHQGTSCAVCPVRLAAIVLHWKSLSVRGGEEPGQVQNSDLPLSVSGPLILT
jgi:hypothetical protein